MQYNKPFDQSDPTAAYVNGNPAAGVQGSIPPAEAIEYPQREIINVIVAAGLTPSNTDLTQLLQAIRLLGAPAKGLLHWGLDVGSVNAVVVTASPALTIYEAGNTIITVPAQTSTAAAVTINVNGLGTKNIVKANGSALVPGDIQQSTLTILVYDGTNFRLNYPAKSDIAAAFVLPGQSTTIYVRTDGSDSNDGGANTSGRAMATLQAALGLAATKALGGSITIQMGNPGTYTAPTSIPSILGTLKIQGDTTAQDSYIISGTGGQGSAVVVASSVTLSIFGLRITNTGSFTSNHTLAAVLGARVTVQNVTLNNGGTGSNTGAHLFAANGSSIGVNPGCVLTGANMGSAFAAYSNSSISIGGTSAVSISSSPTFAQATAIVLTCGNITCLPGSSVTGTVTGTRYNCVTNGTIDVGGGGVNFFPGTVSGTTSTGGQYAP